MTKFILPPIKQDAKWSDSLFCLKVWTMGLKYDEMLFNWGELICSSVDSPRSRRGSNIFVVHCIIFFVIMHLWTTAHFNRTHKSTLLLQLHTLKTIQSAVSSCNLFPHIYNFTTHSTVIHLCFAAWKRKLFDFSFQCKSETHKSFIRECSHLLFWSICWLPQHSWSVLLNPQTQYQTSTSLEIRGEKRINLSLSQQEYLHLPSFGLTFKFHERQREWEHFQSLLYLVLWLNYHWWQIHLCLSLILCL